MKKILVFILSMAVFFGCCVINTVPVFAEGEEETEETEDGISYDDSIRILFTENLQDTMSPHRRLVKTLQEKEDGTEEEVTVAESYGGYAYLKSAINEYRHENTILLDAGDFSTGSVYDTLFTDCAPDLSMLGIMGYDATMLGEREFSNGVGPLTEMLQNAYDAPSLICSNLVFGNDAGSAELKAAYQAWDGRQYKIFEMDAHKIGVFTLFDPACVTSTQLLGGVSLEDPIECGQKMVAALQDAGCDYIICMYHSKGAPQEKDSHDQQLAEQVEGIDLLISGHTVSPTEDLIVVNDTLIVSCGQYGDYLGVVDLDRNTLKPTHIALQQVSPSIYSAEESAASDVNWYRNRVQEYTLNRYGYTFDKVFAVTDFNLTDIDRNSDILSNNSVADLITDAYMEYYEPEERDEQPVIAMVSRRDLTGSLFAGNITAEDIFNIIGRGIGTDGSPSSPLARVYMSGSDLFDLCELDCTVFRDEPENQLYFSNLRYEYSDKRREYDRVVEVYVNAANGYYVPVTKDRLYPVVMEYQLVRRLPDLFAKSGGILECHVRDVFGREVRNIDNMVLQDSSGAEVKPAAAVVRYLTRMSHNGSGQPALDKQYAQARKTKTELKKIGLIDYFRNPSPTALEYYGHILLYAVLFFIGLRLLIFLLNLDWKRKAK